jgi:hypothetical protein
MKEMIVEYIFCFLIYSNLITAWFNTSFGCKILSLIFRMDKHESQKKSYEEIAFSISYKSEYLSDLFSCQICFGTWVSLFLSLVFALMFGLNFYFVIICALSFPSLHYRLFSGN